MITEPGAPADVIEKAWAGLKQGQAPAEILALVGDIGPEDPSHAKALHVRGVCVGRQGDAQQAKVLLIEAIRAGEQGNVTIWTDLAALAAQTGLPDDTATAMLQALIQRVEPETLFPLGQRLLAAVGFATKAQLPWKDAAFDKLAIPLLARLLGIGQIDAALSLEGLFYENYVKSTETEAHFARAMSRMEPLFTAAAHRLRSELPPLPPASLEPPYRVGFFIHNATMLAHIEVLLNALKGYRLLEDQPFEPTVYCFSGKSLELEAALARIGVRLVMLNERFPETAGSGWRRLLLLREVLAEEGVQQLVWVSLVTMLPLAFGLRIAPVQTWWAMKYRNFSQPDIDGYVTGSALTRFGMLCGRRWRMAMLGVDDWYDPGLETEAATLRASLGERLVLMTLARTEKMHDPDYLQAMVAILKAHPDTIFLWAGRTESPIVAQAFAAAGVANRTKFIGWVNTRLYAQVADVFLDTFPFPCGFTLFQAMAAGKPVVIYDSPEAAQTGLWNFLKPVLDDGEGSAEERAELRTIVGEETDPLIAVARSPEDYPHLAGRLIQDPALRATAGAASRRFIDRYFSDPAVMGESMSDHFIDLIQERQRGRTGHDL